MIKQKRLVSLIIASIFILQVIGMNFPITEVKALSNDITSKFQFITGVKLKDGNGNDLSSVNGVDINSKVRIEYGFELPDDVEISSGDYYKMSLPKEIKIVSTISKGIYNGSDKVADLYVGTDGEIKITFTDYVENHLGIAGGFYVECGFDESSIPEKNPVEIYFDIQGDSDPIKIIINFNEPEYDPITVLKSGEYISSSKEIEWKIIVNPKKSMIYANDVFADNIPKGQEYVEGSARIDNGADISGFSYEKSSDGVKTGTLKYKFTENTKNTYTISFKTKPDLNMAQHINKATVMNGDNLIASNEARVNIQVGEVVTSIKKLGKYDEINKKIDWQIIVNENNQSIQNAIVTDTIPKGLALDKESVKLNGVSIQEGKYTYIDNKIIYNFEGTITDKQVITFSTYVDPSYYYTNKIYNFVNTAKLNGDNIPEVTVSSNVVQVVASVISKYGVYDEDKKEITWFIKVNSKSAELNNPKVIDKIPVGLDYIQGSAYISKNGSTDKKYDGFEYNSDKNELTYQFQESIREVYTIVFKTKVQEKYYYTNATVTFKNLAGIEINGLYTEYPSSYMFDSNLIKKSANYTQGNDYIDWTININSNAIPVDSPTIEDKLQDGLELQTDTVTLNKLVKDSSGNITKENIPISEGSIIYDIKTGVFQFKFSGEKIDSTYELNFRTSVTKPGEYSNTASFKGKGVDESSTVNKVGVSYSDGGGWATGTTAKIKIIKVDSEDNSKKLKGAVFELLDQYKNPIKMSMPTGDDGVVIFDKVKYRLAHYIREVTPPEGYEKSDMLYEYKPQSESTGKDIEYVVENGKAKIRGNIEIIKVDPSGNVLEGAEFKIYKKSDTSFSNPIDTKISDVNGLVRFENIESGEYIVKETNAPIGYFLSTEVRFVSIDVNGETIKLGTFVNKEGIPLPSIDGEIKLKKINEEGTPLEGVEFSLIDEKGNIVKTGLTDANGLLEFKDLEYGKYTVKETKSLVGYNTSSEVFNVELSGSSKIHDIGTVTNTKIKGNIQINKVDESSNPLEGAEFTLFDINEKAIKNSVADANGYVKFENIEYGEYNIKETKAPTGYEISDKIIPVSIKENGKTIELGEFVNNKIPKDGIIKLKKINEEGTPLEGVEFSLIDEKGNIVKNSLTDANGLLEFKDLEYGKYTVKETKPLVGYNTSSEVFNVELSGSSKIHDIGTVTNTKIKGNIQINKVDESSNPLEGAEFTLFDINEKAIKNSVADANGYVKFENIEYGDYNIKETKAPTGYEISDKIIPVSIKENGKIIELGEFVNDKIDSTNNDTEILDDDGIIKLKKLNEEGTPLEGVEFSLIDENGQVVRTLTTDANGLLEFKELEYGKYTVKETKPLVGYKICTESFNANLSETQKTLDIGTIINTKIKGSIEFVKIGEGSDLNGLKGAEFTLYAKNDSTYSTSVATAISDDNGRVHFKNIEYGEYRIKETKAPSGYNLSSEVIPVSIKVDKETVVLSKFVNNKITSNNNGSGSSNNSGDNDDGIIKLKKIGEDNTPLKGVEFALLDENQKIIKTGLTDINGLLEFKGLRYGKYTVKETRALDGYKINNISFISKLDSVNRIYDIGTIINTKIKGDVQINKVDENLKPLKGAEFTLFDSNGQSIKSKISGSNGIIIFENLVYGEYVIKETKSPKGYAINKNPINVSIKTSETQVFTVENKVDKNAEEEDKDEVKPGDEDSDNTNGDKEDNGEIKPEDEGKDSTDADKEDNGQIKPGDENTDSNAEKIKGKIPQTGFALDTVVLLVAGVVSVIIGAIMLITRYIFYRQ
ncbi:SpaA isopeptide-forming pilin-related protein [Clostridium cylindrosporum]|uniref:Cna B domain protein n=1 Tax=Clostridium cylindrosporum DSM 605 TaxID=1121307 RepID=A0A0J8D7J0_CLOCY|nr:SpaA isopeptide-forming pilin-related protein [Clostridium cylindrosporum]KMT21862.1 Cna B domain protein [Clostridium cylindrosporum DSM 605]